MISLTYLGIHGFMAVIFALNVIRQRWRTKVSLGHGDKPELLTATRIFGNHNEYAPLLLLLLYVSETQGASAMFVHSIGILFTAGRLLHAIGLSIKPHGPSIYRFVGMNATFASLIACAIFLLRHAQV